MTQTHFFLALPIPDEVKQTLQQSLEKEKENLHFKNWVHPEDYHITLAFLGNSSLANLEEVKKRLPEVLSKNKPFKLNLTEYNTFGQPRRPRIFWIGVTNSDLLSQLQSNVFQTCIDIGYELDSKPFKPHITLARKWNNDNDYKISKSNDRDEDKGLGWLVKEVVLYQTHLKKTPKYEVKETFKIGDK